MMYARSVVLGLRDGISVTSIFASFSLCTMTGSIETFVKSAYKDLLLMVLMMMRRRTAMMINLDTEHPSPMLSFQLSFKSSQLFQASSNLEFQPFVDCLFDPPHQHLYCLMYPSFV